MDRTSNLTRHNESRKCRLTACLWLGVAGCGWARLADGPQDWPPSGITGPHEQSKRLGEDGIFFEHAGLCRDPERHRNCPGRWRGVISLGFGPDRKRIRRKVSGKTRAVVQARLKALHSDLDSGIKASPNYTLRRAPQD